jgi:hypothetical protein
MKSTGAGSRSGDAARRLKLSASKKTLQGEPVSDPTRIEPPTPVGRAQQSKLPQPDKPPQALSQELHRPPAKPERAISSIASERAEILRRVASFRAHQLKLGLEREKYYEGVQEKIQTSLGNPFKKKPL